MNKNNNRKTAAIVTAEGFGDGLIMLIAANFLYEQGYSVTVYNKQLPSFTSFSPNLSLLPYPEDITSYKQYDMLILQHDNTPRAKSIAALRPKNKKLIHIFYPNYKASKHGALDCLDSVFDPTIPMADNVCLACENLQLPGICNKNRIGLTLPKNLIYRKHKKRVVLHPVSRDINRNWSKKKFIKLARKLTKLGYDPVFILSEWEQDYFENEDVKRFIFSSLSDLSSFIYESSYFIGNESGPSHLASYLQIPSSIITNNKKRMSLWQPGWRKAQIIAAPRFIPNLKILRLREKKWQFFISVNSVIKSFLTNN